MSHSNLEERTFCFFSYTKMKEIITPSTQTVSPYHSYVPQYYKKHHKNENCFSFSFLPV